MLNTLSQKVSLSLASILEVSFRISTSFVFALVPFLWQAALLLFPLSIAYQAQ